MGEMEIIQKHHSREFYTQNGWKGGKYEETKNLSTTEIAKLIRKEIKQKFPNIKASVRTEYFSGGSAINVVIKECNFNPINPNYQLNSIALAYQNPRYTDRGQKLLDDIEKIGNQYRYSDCDGMIDYFNVNFWFDVRYSYEFENECMKKLGIIKE